MPLMPPTFRPGGSQSKRERGKAHDTVRRKAKPWRKWYSRKVWLVRRADQLAREPLCRRCNLIGEATVATVANHVVPHRGDWALFVTGELESLCAPCHDGVVQREERRA